jgi:hypothetical protein
VLLPAPDEGPALTNYQEAGQFWGDWPSHCLKKKFAEKPVRSDSKTGRVFCTQIMQNWLFA